MVSNDSLDDRGLAEHRSITEQQLDRARGHVNAKCAIHPQATTELIDRLEAQQGVVVEREELERRAFAETGKSYRTVDDQVSGPAIRRPRRY